jgi:ribonucleoside-diphosphate reductase alpha chain
LGERTMYHPLYEELIGASEHKDLPDYFVTADELTPREHVVVQALIQKYTDSSISKTVNAPKTHSIKDVKKLYTLAWKLGCKGISYMREGSREATLVREKKEEKIQKDKPNGEAKHFSLERPMKVSGSTYKLMTPVGTAFITINHDADEAPMEVFINIGRAGSDVQAMAEALGRLISKSLKFSSTISAQDRAMVIIDQLKGIGGTRPVGFGANRITSLPDAVAKALIMDMGIQEISLVKTPHIVSDNSPERKSVKQERKFATLNKSADFCPSCGNATLVHEMGCKTCYSCGYSEC